MALSYAIAYFQQHPELVAIPDKLPRPATPPGMGNPAFGKLVNWGGSSAAARAQIANISRESLQAAGVTREMAIEWAKFYANVAIRNPNNPSAAGRAELMAAIADALK